MLTYNGLGWFDPRSGDRGFELEHGGEYHANVAWTADGAYLVATDYEGRIRFWSAEDGALVQELEGDATGLGLASLVDGTLLITREKRGHVERVDLGGEVDRIELGAESLSALVAARDAPVAAVIAGDETIVFDVDTHRVLSRHEGYPSARALGLSDDGAQLVVTWGSGTGVYSVATGERLVWHDGIGYSAFSTPRFLADDALLVCSKGGLAVLEHGEHEPAPAVLVPLARVARSIARPASSPRPAVSPRPAPEATPRRRAMKAEYGRGFYCADFTRDGELFVAGSYSEAFVFDRRTGARRHRLGRGAGQLAVSPDDRHVVLTYNGLSWFDPHTGDRGFPIEHRDEYHANVAWTADGAHLVATDYEGRIRFWSAEDGALVQELGGEATGLGLAALADGTMLITREKLGHVERVDMGGEVDRIDFGAEHSWGVVTARDVPVAAVVAGDDVVIFDPDAHEILQRIPGFTYANALALSDDGSQVAIVEVHGTYVYAVADGKRIVHHGGSSSSFRTPRFLSDHEVLAVRDGALVVLSHEEEPSLAGEPSPAGEPRRTPPRRASASVELGSFGAAYRAAAVERVDASTLRVRRLTDEARVDIELSDHGWLRITVSEPDLLEPSWIRPGPLLRMARWVRGKLGVAEPRDEHDAWAEALVPGATADRAPGALMLTAPRRGTPSAARLRELVDAVVDRWRALEGATARKS